MHHAVPNPGAPRTGEKKTQLDFPSINSLMHLLKLQPALSHYTDKIVTVMGDFFPHPAARELVMTL